MPSPAALPEAVAAPPSPAAPPVDPPVAAAAVDAPEIEAPPAPAKQDEAETAPVPETPDAPAVESDLESEAPPLEPETERVRQRGLGRRLLSRAKATFEPSAAVVTPDRDEAAGVHSDEAPLDQPVDEPVDEAVDRTPAVEPDDEHPVERSDDAAEPDRESPRGHLVPFGSLATRVQSAGSRILGERRDEPEVSGPGCYRMSHRHRTVMIGCIVVTVVAGGLAVILALAGGGLPAGALVPVFVALVSFLVLMWVGGMSTDVDLADGVLTLRLGDMHHKFDLNSDATAIEVSGSPDEGDWRMVFVRRGLSPVEINSRLVDPQPFTAAVGHWRPDLVDAG